MDFIRRRLRKFLEGDSLVLALIYTVGHIVIAMIGLLYWINREIIIRPSF